MGFNGFSTKSGIFDLILSSASSFALRDKQRFKIWVLNMEWRFFFFLDVIVESEDNEGIPSSILLVTDDLVFLRHHF